MNVPRSCCCHSHRFPRFLCATPPRAAAWRFLPSSLRFSQFAVSTLFGVRPSAHPRSPPPGEYACVPSFQSRQESARKSRAPLSQTPPAAPAQASDFRSLLPARPAKQISCLLLEKPAILHESTLPPPPGSGQSCENLLRSLVDSHTAANDAPCPTLGTLVAEK